MNVAVHSDIRKPLTILLVENNAGDIRLAKEALQQCEAANTLHVVTNGAEAIKYLRDAPGNSERRIPHVVLLDLNLPDMSGHEVLKQMKSDPILRVIPVIILSTSSSENDIQRSYNLAANAYVVKPIDFDKFVNIMQTIERFWLSAVTLPIESVARA